MSTALEKQLAEQRVGKAQRALRERQCYPDNHTAHVPQDTRPWAATTSQMTAAEEVLPSDVDNTMSGSALQSKRCAVQA